MLRTFPEMTSLVRRSQTELLVERGRVTGEFWVSFSRVHELILSAGKMSVIVRATLERDSPFLRPHHIWDRVRHVKSSTGIFC